MRVYDASNSSIEGTKEIQVVNYNTSYETNKFEVSTNRQELPARNYANLTIRALDRHNSTNINASNTIKFEVYRRENSYRPWNNITSSYGLYTLNPNTYTFRTSDRGTVTLRDAISFNEQGYEYLVKVIDYHNNSIYGETKFEVKNRNTPPITNTIRRYVGFTSPQVPELYEPIGATISAKNDNNTTTSHTNRVNFSLERKLLPTSNVWTKTGVATSCKLNTRSYTFSHSDKGQVTLNNIMRCNKKGFYRLKITDHYNNNIIGYIYFTIVDARDFAYYVHGFTTAQRQDIQEEYRTFMAQVNAWEAQYPRLSYNKRWDTAWKNYYNVLNKITYDKAGRVANYAGYERAREKFLSTLYQLQ